MSNDTPIDLNRLEALANDAPEDMTEVCLTADGPTAIVYDEARAFYVAARTALPTLIAAYRQLTIVADCAAELVQADAALIRALEDRLATESTKNEQLRTELGQAQFIIARATDHAATQLRAYRDDANASGDGTAVYHAALCHHYTQMVSVLRSPNE